MPPRVRATGCDRLGADELGAESPIDTAAQLVDERASITYRPKGSTGRGEPGRGREGFDMSTTRPAPYGAHRAQIPTRFVTERMRVVVADIEEPAFQGAADKLRCRRRRGGVGHRVKFAMGTYGTRRRLTRGTLRWLVEGLWGMTVSVLGGDRLSEQGPNAECGCHISTTPDPRMGVDERDRVPTTILALRLGDQDG